MSHCNKVCDLVFAYLIYKTTAVCEDDKDANENGNIAIPLLMKNALPDVEGFEKNEKLDIAMRPEEVRKPKQPRCHCPLLFLREEERLWA